MSDLKEFDLRAEKLIRLIYQVFEKIPYPSDYAIGLKLCATSSTNNRDYQNDSSEEIEVYFRGGEEDSYYDLTDNSYPESFDMFVNSHSPVNWWDLAGKRLADWSYDSDYVYFMPAASAYYLPAYMVTYAPAFYKEIPGLPCYYDAAYNPLELLLNQFRTIPDGEIWERGTKGSGDKGVWGQRGLGTKGSGDKGVWGQRAQVLHYSNLIYSNGHG